MAGLGSGFVVGLLVGDFGDSGMVASFASFKLGVVGFSIDVVDGDSAPLSASLSR